MKQSKFESIKAAALGYSKDEYVSSYPSLTKEQITILTEGEIDEPIRESVPSSTNTNSQGNTSKWRKFRQLDTKSSGVINRKS